jgi:hypothetical protein
VGSTEHRYYECGGYLVRRDTAAPATNPGDTWGVANDASAADAWGTATKRIRSTMAGAGAAAGGNVIRIGVAAIRSLIEEDFGAIDPSGE